MMPRRMPDAGCRMPDDEKKTFTQYAELKNICIFAAVTRVNAHRPSNSHIKTRALSLKSHNYG